VLTNKILKPRIRVFASDMLEVDIGVVHVLEVMLHCASSAVHHGLFTAQPWERIDGSETVPLKIQCSENAAY
jgi:hypothetical protein